MVYTGKKVALSALSENGR